MIQNICSTRIRACVHVRERMYHLDRQRRHHRRLHSTFCLAEEPPSRSRTGSGIGRGNLSRSYLIMDSIRMEHCWCERDETDPWGM